MICRYRSLSLDSSIVDRLNLIGRYQTLCNGKDNNRMLTVDDAPLEPDAFNYWYRYDPYSTVLSASKESLVQIGGGPGGRGWCRMSVTSSPVYEFFKKG